MVYATEFFITISPRHEITTNTLEKVKKYTQKHLDINHIIIQENGKNGDHPHLHIYGSCKVQKRTNAFKINFITHLWKNELTPEERKHTIDIRKAHHIDKLLGWYFQKEEDSKLILNKGIDLANFKVKYEKTLQKVKYELPKSVSFSNAPFFFIAFMKQNYEDYWKQMTSKPSSPNYLGFEDINTIITLTLRHNYATHTLLKNKEDILFAINSILSKDSIII